MTWAAVNGDVWRLVHRAFYTFCPAARRSSANIIHGRGMTLHGGILPFHTESLAVNMAGSYNSHGSVTVDTSAVAILNVSTIISRHN